MAIATQHFEKGQWPGQAIDRVTLPFDSRHRRRILLTADSGREFLLNLPEAVLLSDGDGLALEDGSYIEIRAGEEPLLEICPTAKISLARLAWHLGNRHLPTQIFDHFIRVRQDHVIEHMVLGLGAECHHINAPFQPEGGAYEGHNHG